VHSEADFTGDLLHGIEADLDEFREWEADLLAFQDVLPADRGGKGLFIHPLQDLGLTDAIFRSGYTRAVA
jgi:hypothetical protein